MMVTSLNTGFAASFHFAQTAFGGFAKPENVSRNSGARLKKNKVFKELNFNHSL